MPDTDHSGKIPAPAVHGTARWLRRIAWPEPGRLLLNGTEYDVVPLPERGQPVDPDRGPAKVRAYRLINDTNGKQYEVNLVAGTCGCDDFLRRDRPGGCKHLKGLRAALRSVGAVQEDGRQLVLSASQREALERLAATGQPLVPHGGFWTTLGTEVRQPSGLPAWYVGPETFQRLLEAGLIERLHVVRAKTKDHHGLSAAGRRLLAPEGEPEDDAA